MPHDARHALLARLIDHAPLYPPASLPLEEAIAEDRRARESPDSWVLGRLVWPASRLEQLGDERRELSVVLDEARTLDDERIEAIEIPPGQRDEVRAPEVYVELDPEADLPGWLERLSEAGFRAKIRCGGTRVPSASELAGFIRLCRERRVPFKATAGLHHAVRQGGQHGFLNLLAAAVFGHEEAALAEEESAAFRLTAQQFGWRDRSAGPAELSRVRRDLFVGFGSCSFFEPVEELQSMGFLSV